MEISQVIIKPKEIEEEISITITLTSSELQSLRSEEHKIIAYDQHRFYYSENAPELKLSKIIKEVDKAIAKKQIKYMDSIVEDLVKKGLVERKSTGFLNKIFK